MKIMVTYNWRGTPATTMANVKAWPKLAGPRVTENELANAASMLRHHGTAKHLALAMYLRANGATQVECIAATGDTAVNAYSEAWRNGHAVQVAVNGRNGHKAYCLALPSKGKGKASKPAAAASKGKGKGKGKPASKAGKPASKPAAAASKPAASNDGNGNGNGNAS